ncbi:MAG: AMMECR1 domain-containing protein, partial [Halothiobacillaceae bacterium]
FQDPRFSPIAETEIDCLEISISVLTPLQKIEATTEEELLQQLQVGHDGLVLEEGHYRATFLPKVWQSLPDKGDFVRQLKHKAGLPNDYWSDKMRCYRYSVIEIAEQDTPP